MTTFKLKIDGKTGIFKAYQRRDYGAGWGQFVLDMGPYVGLVSTVQGEPMGDLEVLKIKPGHTAQTIAADKTLSDWATGRVGLYYNPAGRASNVYVRA